MSIEGKKADFREKVGALSAALLRLGTGELAELRRMETNGPGCAAFWQLAAACGFIGEVNRTDTWMRIVKFMALLAPKGERTRVLPVHDPARRLGAALCDGGNPDWGAGVETRPFLSETRLMRFLSEPPRQRAETLVRFARTLATNRDPRSGVDCNEIAALLLFPDKKTNLQDVARAYYRRLDPAMRRAKKEEKPA